MAEGMSGRGAYWLGAFTGLVFSAAVGAALSIWLPESGSPEEPVDIAAAPVPEPGASDAVTAAAPEPEAPAVAGPAIVPEPDSAPEAAPEPAMPAPAADGDAPSPVSAEADPAPDAGSAPVAAAPAVPPPPAEPEPSAPALPEAAAPPAATAGTVEPAPPAAPEPPEETATPAPIAPDARAEAPAATEAPAPDAEPAPAVEAETAGIEPGPPGFALNRAPFEGEPDAPILVVALSGVDEAAFEDAARLPFPVTVLLSVEGEAGARLAAAAQAAGLESVSPSAPGDAVGPVIGVALSEPIVDREAFFAALAARDLALLDIGAGRIGRVQAGQGGRASAAPLGLRIDEIANSEIVYQSLERAALEARKRGVFVAVGEANQAVLAGLRRWMSVKAGKTIALAPLSAAIDRIPAR